MNIARQRISRHPGISLTETVIAMGVLAVAIPLVFGALAESGKSNLSSEAETRSTWIVPACMAEIQASREGASRFFAATRAGETFPPGGGVWALAYSADGKLVGKIEKAAYDQGVKEINGQPVRYIASLSSAQPVPATAPPVMLNVRVSLEYPSGTPAAKRRKLEFHTRIP